MMTIKSYLITMFKVRVKNIAVLLFTSKLEYFVESESELHRYILSVLKTHGFIYGWPKNNAASCTVHTTTC